MAANTAPIYPAKPNIGYGFVSAANTALDGTGTVVLLFTAHATEGSFVESLKVKHRGTNVATVLRIFGNNGSVPTTAGNNWLEAELALAANTISQTAQSLETLLITLNLKLPATYRLYGSVGTVIAAGVAVRVQGGDYGV